MYAPGGNNFQPGEERVHINHWIFAGQTAALAGESSALPASSTFVLSKFKFTPLTELLKNHDRSVNMTDHMPSEPALQSRLVAHGLTGCCYAVHCALVAQQVM
jgi:hypothetical protein